MKRRRRRRKEKAWVSSWFEGVCVWVWEGRVWNWDKVKEMKRGERKERKETNKQHHKEIRTGLLI